MDSNLENKVQGEKVQPISPIHVVPVMNVLRKAYAETKYPIGGGWTHAQVLDELKHGQGLGIWESQELVAFVIYRDLGGILEIIILASLPARARCGFARKLIEAMKAKLAREERIWLEVHERNLPAISLYESCGFQRLGRRPKYYRDGGSAFLYSFDKLD